MEKIFETATRNKLRFESMKGDITVEDLWDAPLTSKEGFDLDTIARAANKKVKGAEEESFVKPVTSSNTVLVLRLEVIKHIIAVKLKEREDREQATEKKAKKERILEIISKKQDADLIDKSIEELTKELESL